MTTYFLLNIYEKIISKYDNYRLYDNLVHAEFL